MDTALVKVPVMATLLNPKGSFQSIPGVFDAVDHSFSFYCFFFLLLLCSPLLRIPGGSSSSSSLLHSSSCSDQNLAVLLTSYRLTYHSKSWGFIFIICTAPRHISPPPLAVWSKHQYLLFCHCCRLTVVPASVFQCIHNRAAI